MKGVSSSITFQDERGCNVGSEIFLFNEGLEVEDEDACKYRCLQEILGKFNADYENS